MKDHSGPGGSAPPADAIAAVTHPDPYPYYAALAAAPAAYDPRLRLWIVAAPALVRAVLAHPDCRVRPVHEPVPAALAGPAGSLFGALARMNDGPRHAGPKAALLRALAALSPAVVNAAVDAALSIRIDAEVDADVAADVAAAVAAAQESPAVADAAALNAYVAGVPVRAVAASLGFAPARLAQVEQWVRAFARCLSPLATPADIERAHDAASALLAAVREQVHGSPAGPLLAAALAQPWPDEHTLLANLAGLLSQTCEATAGLLGNCVVALAREPGADRATLAATVAERDPAIHNTRRYAAADVSFDGMTVRAGEGMLLVLANADGFGAGRHGCPGQALALAIVTRALAALPAAPQGVRWAYQPSVNARMPFFMEAV